MNDHVILCIGDRKFILTPDEALSVANTLNGASRITSEWRSGGSKLFYDKPQLDACYIVPINAPLQLELEANTNEKEKK